MKLSVIIPCIDKELSTAPTKKQLQASKKMRVALTPFLHV